MNLLQHANKLYEQGFAVIPTKEDKSPIPKAWPSLVGDNRLVPNGEYDNAKGCGVVLGHWQDRGYLHCLDIDCYNKEISRAMCEYIAQVIDREYPYRIGQAPKFAVPILLPEPWTKATSALFQRQGDESKNSQVEMLGVGQQFVAYGAHPDGKKGQYQWYNGDLSLDDVPLITNEQLVLILTHFDVLCGDAGRVLMKDPSYVKHTDDALDDLDVAINNQPLGLSKQEIKSALTNFPAQDLEYHDWCMVGMALWHEYGGSEAGYQRWLKWSKKSDKHVERGMSRKWLSFESEGGKPVTMRSVIKRGKAVDVPEYQEEPEPETTSVLARGCSIQWVVEGIIEQGTIGQIYGPSGSGKSFMALDLAAKVITGSTWFEDHRTVPGKVIHLAGEGIDGIQRRKAALELKHGIDTSNIIVKPMPQFSEKAHIKALTRILDAQGDISIIFIDTLARAMIGLNENDTGDMGRMIEIMARLARKYQCAVCAIHHTGKGAQNQARGSSALRAALDFEIAIEPGAGGNLIKCAKVKDVEPFEDKAFSLESVALPSNFTDNFGNTIYSAVVTPVDLENVVANTQLTPTGQMFADAFEAVWTDETARIWTPQALVDQYELDAPAEGLMEDRVRDHWRRSMPDLDSLTQATIRKRWARGLADCKDKGRYNLFDGIVVKL